MSVNVDPAKVVAEELFRAEERDESWAAQRERALSKPLVEAAAAESAKIEHFECRRFICRVIASRKGDGGFLHEIEGVLRDDGAEMLVYAQLPSEPDVTRLALYMEYGSRDGARNPREYPRSEEA